MDEPTGRDGPLIKLIFTGVNEFKYLVSDRGGRADLATYSGLSFGCT